MPSFTDAALPEQPAEVILTIANNLLTPEAREYKTLMRTAVDNVEAAEAYLEGVGNTYEVYQDKLAETMRIRDDNEWKCNEAFKGGKTFMLDSDDNPPGRVPLRVYVNAAKSALETANTSVSAIEKMITGPGKP